MKTSTLVTRAWPVIMTALGILLSGSCQHAPAAHDDQDGSPWPGFEPLVAMAEGPTYHLLTGYDPVWLRYVQQGVERARAYWGSYGPAHVWIAGCEQGSQINADAKRAFLDEYCTWRTASSPRTKRECWPHAEERFFEVIGRDEAEAYLSLIRDSDPHMAELIFINVHKWHFGHDAVPDPVLRGIHEYTHVFQQAMGPIPTWMAEGGAVFAEAWLPGLDGQRKPEVAMQRAMQQARRSLSSGLSIADMEEIETAPEEVARFHRELAYDAGAWATALMVYKSPTKSVATLRDVFYPLVQEIGWEAALCKYVDIRNKAAFYAEFATFMAQPTQTHLSVLRALKP